MDLEAVLKSPEGKTLEYKRDLSSPDKVLKSVVAFANTAGGTLLIGVEDSSREVCGVANPESQAERLACLISDSIEPRLVPDIELIPWRDTHVLAAQIHLSNNRPHFLKSTGPEKGVYVRVGSTSRPADRDLSEELRRSSNGEIFDEQAVPELDLEAIDFQAACQAFAPFRELSWEDLETLRLITTHQGRKVPSNGGILLFGKVRERYFLDAWIKAGRFRGTDKTEILDSIEIRGHLVDAVESAIAFVDKHVLHGVEIGAVRRTERWSLPEKAVREAIINAVAHADYSQRGSPIHVAFFDDRLEIENPGLLLPGLTIEEMHRGVSKLRNRVIGRCFHELKLMEHWGSGIQRMTTACLDAGLSPPELEELGLRFRVTLRSQPREASQAMGTPVGRSPQEIEAVKYSDLKLEIVPREGEDGWQIQWDSLREPFEIPFSTPKMLAELGRRLRRFQEAQGRDEESRQQLDEMVTSLGQELFQSLFTGRLAESFRELIRKVRAEFDHGLRVRIAWNPVHEGLSPIGGLPWEVMLFGLERFGLSRDLVVSRFLGTENPIPRFRTSELRILVVASQPNASIPIRAEEEIRELRRAVQHDHRIYVATEGAVITKVRQRLIAGRFHVLHFIGHGHFHPETGGAQILWATETNDKLWLTAQEFAEQLAQIDHLRLVVLSSSSSTALPRDDGQNAYNAIAPALIRRGLPAVIGMQFPMTHQAAIDFSRGFYQSLATGMAIDSAATEARFAMAGKANPEWIVPSVFMQMEDGHFLDPNVDLSESLQIGIRSFANGHRNGMERAVDRFLSLDRFFDATGRQLQSGDPRVWQTKILPELETFLSQLYGDRRRFQFDFAVLWSIAFATGYFLEAKNGLNVEIFQRPAGPGEGKYLKAIAGEESGSLWWFESLVIDESATDVALAISITQKTVKEVETFLKEKDTPRIKRLIHAHIEGDSGQKAVRDGTHALQLARQLVRYCRTLDIAEQRATLHLFCAAPNVFSFYFGQLAKALGDLQLYEHHFGEIGDYRPSFRFPPSKLV